MVNKKIKYIVLLISTISLILIFIGVLLNISSPGFSLYEFARGMLFGIGGVATVVWLISLANLISRTDKSKGAIISILKNKYLLLSILIFLLILGTEVAVYLSGNQILLTAGIIITGVSIFLNKLNLTKKKCGKLLDA